jgi:hypothetical protein
MTPATRDRLRAVKRTGRRTTLCGSGPEMVKGSIAATHAVAVSPAMSPLSQDRADPHRRRRFAGRPEHRAEDTVVVDSTTRHASSGKELCPVRASVLDGALLLPGCCAT